jgi:hypothetical protein
MTTSDVSDSSSPVQDPSPADTSSGDKNAQDLSLQTAIPTIQQTPASTTTVLTGAKTPQPDTAILRALMKSHPSMTPAQRETLFQQCLADYRKSVAAYERIAGKVAFDHPAAKKFAAELAQKLEAILTAYNEILEEERAAGIVLDGSAQSTQALLVRKDLMRMIRLVKFFGNESSNPGSVGMNALAIQAAIFRGNLREQMTLAYRTIFSFLINEVLDKPGMIDKVNEKLAALPLARRFQIDKALVEKEMQDGTGIVDSPDGRMLKQIPIVGDYRNVENGRVRLQNPTPSQAPQGLDRDDIPDLSDREIRTGIEYRPDSDIRWISGSKYFSVSPDCTFAKDTESLGSLPISTGPSGTTDGVIHLGRYLGFAGHEEAATLACIGWMLPTKDHTLHEVRAAADAYGVSYKGMPDDFATLYSSDPQVVAQINKELAAKGLKNPSYYFSAEHQQKVADSLAPAAPPVDHELETNQGIIRECLQGYGDGIHVDHLRNLNEPPEVQLQLQVFNTTIRKLEAGLKRLIRLRETTVGNAPLVKLIRAKEVELREQYEDAELAKLDFVKLNVTPINQVYALCIPRTLPTGLEIYTANSPGKVERILYTEGFSQFTDPNMPSTPYGANYVAGQWGANELGEKGHYFSVGSPAYLRNDTLGVRFVTTRNIDGVSVMSVSELRERDGYRFSGAQIEAGYQMVHQNYPFLQNYGLPPKDTEVVFLRGDGALRVDGIFMGPEVGHITMNVSRTEYLALMGDDENKPLHPSWAAPAARHLDDAANQGTVVDANNGTTVVVQS